MPSTYIERFIRLVQILYTQTDAEHMLTRSEIMNQMRENGAEINRQTFAAYLKIMRDHHFDIMEEKTDHFRYAVGQRTFDIAEVKLIIDAVLSASVIDEEKSRELINKLHKLVSRHQASQLIADQLPVYRRKQVNRYFYQNVDIINMAVTENKKISFQYLTCRIDQHGNLEKVPRRQGREYIVSPYSFCWEQDNYYVLVSDDHHEGLASYRIDRMDCVRLVNESRKPLQDCQIGDLKALSRYISRMFSMHSGEQGKWVRAELEFDEKVLNVIVDKFGEFSVYQRRGTKITVNFGLIASPVFFSWLFQLGDQIRIVSPASLAEEYRLALKKVISLYP